MLIIKKFKLNKSEINLVSFHGHTIFHNFKERKTIQIGDGKLLSQLSKLNVVNNFRENDILSGGEGAPLSPIFHDLIIKNNIDIKKFNHWVIDVQGAELEVLKGSIDSLKFCDSIVIEVSTEKFYNNGSKFQDVKKILSNYNFEIIKEPKRKS